MAAFITVCDAAGRVLFRRAATEDEVTAALRTAEIAELESRSHLARIVRERMSHERDGAPVDRKRSRTEPTRDADVPDGGDR